MYSTGVNIKQFTTPDMLTLIPNSEGVEKSLLELVNHVKASLARHWESEAYWDYYGIEIQLDKLLLLHDYSNHYFKC